MGRPTREIERVKGGKVAAGDGKVLYQAVIEDPVGIFRRAHWRSEFVSGECDFTLFKMRGKGLRRREWLLKKKEKRKIMWE